MHGRPQCRYSELIFQNCRRSTTVQQISKRAILGSCFKVKHLYNMQLKKHPVVEDALVTKSVTVYFFVLLLTSLTPANLPALLCLASLCRVCSFLPFLPGQLFANCQDRWISSQL